MKIVSSVEEMVGIKQECQRRQQTIALVPTMGCLHAGHLSLLKKGRELADCLILSIFVNPMQFGPHEDFDAYPRQMEKDCELAMGQSVDVVFCPDQAEMYGTGFQTLVRVTELSQGMCGADRPGHFDGVATVVTKLFNITGCHFGIFGEKDFQQLALIKQLAHDLNMPLSIVGCPIVREKDGLAMSSRNKYLDGDSRQKALCLYRSLQTAREIVAGSTHPVPATQIVRAARETILQAGGELEYAVVINDTSLRHEEVIGPHSILAVAVKIDNKVRLIDNARLLEM